MPVSRALSPVDQFPSVVYLRLAIPVPADLRALRHREGDGFVGDPVGGVDGPRDGGSEDGPDGGTVGPSEQI